MPSSKAAHMHGQPFGPLNILYSLWLSIFLFALRQKDLISCCFIIPVLGQANKDYISAAVANSWLEVRMINFGGKPLDLIIYIIINRTCVALRPHKYMSGPLGLPNI